MLRIEAVSTTMRQLVFSKVAGSSEPSSYTFTLSSPQSAAIEVVAAANAKQVSATSGAFGSGTEAVAPGVSSSQGLQVAFFSVARIATITPNDPTFASTVVADGQYDISLQGSRRATADSASPAMSASISKGTWVAQTALLS